MTAALVLISISAILLVVDKVHNSPRYLSLIVVGFLLAYKNSTNMQEIVNDSFVLYFLLVSIIIISFVSFNLTLKGKHK